MRDEYGRFMPGESGNPSGRPRGAYEMRVLIRKLAPVLVEELTEIVRDRRKPSASRVHAATVLLDRAYGRPGRAEPVKPTQELKHLSDEELDELIAAGEEDEGAGDEPADGGALGGGAAEGE